MIPAIGYIIAFYIIARGVSFLTRTGDREENPVAKAFFIVAMVVAVIGIVILLTSELSIPSSPF